MPLDHDKLDDAVLALLHLTSFGNEFGHSAWKGHDWDALSRLHEKGYISNPKNKNKSIVFSEEGWERSKQLFEERFK